MTIECEVSSVVEMKEMECVLRGINSKIPKLKRCYIHVRVRAVMWNDRTRCVHSDECAAQVL